MLSLSHKNLEIWKKSVEFVSFIYTITELFPQTEIYGITNQLRRGAVSIPSNISEGASRRGIKDRRRFYEIARSSLVEMDTQLEISIRLKYINESQITELSERINHVFAMLTNLIEGTK